MRTHRPFIILADCAIRVIITQYVLAIHGTVLMHSSHNLGSYHTGLVGCSEYAHGRGWDTILPFTTRGKPLFCYQSLTSIPVGCITIWAVTLTESTLLVFTLRFVLRSTYMTTWRLSFTSAGQPGEASFVAVCCKPLVGSKDTAIWSPSLTLAGQPCEASSAAACTQQGINRVHADRATA